MGGKSKSKGPPTKIYKVWYPYCPFPDLCTKGSAHLGRCYSKGEAEAKLFNHLKGSPFHDLDQKSAGDCIEASPGSIVEHEEEWEPKDLEEYEKQLQKDKEAQEHDEAQPQKQAEHQQQQQWQDPQWQQQDWGSGYGAGKKRKQLTEGSSSASSSGANAAVEAIAQMQQSQQQQLAAAYSFCKAEATYI